MDFASGFVRLDMSIAALVQERLSIHKKLPAQQESYLSESPTLVISEYEARSVALITVKV
jgi:hypothetical protein